MGACVHIDRSETQRRLEAGGDPESFAKRRCEKPRRVFRAGEIDGRIRELTRRVDDVRPVDHTRVDHHLCRRRSSRIRQHR